MSAVRRHSISHRARVLATAVAIDLALGEPPTALHPVVWIGRAITVLEQRAPRRGRARQLVYGAGMSALVVGGSAAAARLFTATAARSSFGLLGEAWLLKSTFAVRALLAAGESVRRPLQADDLPAARFALRSLVSRETAGLTPELVAAAAIESLAENLTDSALAPWLAYAVGGLPAVVAYRALNTLDSRVGYRGHYEYLGKVAARADDLANLLPARVGALLIAAAAPLGRGSVNGALLGAVRDHQRTASPNAGWTMAAMAGALGVRLEKPGQYRLGRGGQPRPDDIRRAQRVVAGALAGGALLAATLTEVLVGRQGRRASPWRSADG